MRLQLQNTFIYQKGFTLIELLVVMAVIAVLAGIVLAGVNPLQQLARGRDANRINAISGLGRAMNNYATVTNGGTFPATSVTWQSPLQSSGEIATVVNLPTITSGNCTAANMHGTSNVCYIQFSTTAAAVWTILESDLSEAKANNCTTAPAVAAYVWMSSAGKAGYACLTNNTTPPGSGQTLY